MTITTEVVVSAVAVVSLVGGYVRYVQTTAEKNYRELSDKIREVDKGCLDRETFRELIEPIRNDLHDVRERLNRLTDKRG